MATRVPLFPQRNLFSTSSSQSSALQIIRHVAEQEDAVELNEDEAWAAESGKSPDDATSVNSPAGFQERTSALQQQVTVLSFTSVEDLEKANHLLTSVLSLKDEIKRYHEPIKRPLKEAHAAACKAEHEDLDPVVVLEKQLKQGIAVLDLKVQQLEAEAARAREQAAAEAGAAMQQEMIEAARQSGASEEVLTSLGAMQVLVPIAKPDLFARPKGYSTRDQFEVEVTDILLLAKAVIAGHVQKEVLQANMKLLAAMAKASNGDLEIPGVRIQKKLSVAGRRTR